MLLRREAGRIREVPWEKVMPKRCDHTSVGQIIWDASGRILTIDRHNYPQAVALPAGHVDGDGCFAEATLRETKEEVGVVIPEEKNCLVFQEKIDNPCKRKDGTHHLWGVYEARTWNGEVRAGSDAKNFRWLTPTELQDLAFRTQQFSEKYEISCEQVGHLTKAIFRDDPTGADTDLGWLRNPGLEPVWWYMLKKIGILR